MAGGAQRDMQVAALGGGEQRHAGALVESQPAWPVRQRGQCKSRPQYSVR